MSVEKITLTRAIVEAKNLDDRIAVAISGGLFVGLERGISNPRPVDTRYSNSKEVEERIRSSIDKINGLIDRRAKLKSLIAEANVKTPVTIAGKQMKIIEAIDYKKTLVFKQTVLGAARQQLHGAAVAIEQNRIRMDADVQKYVESILGKEGNAKNAVDQNTSMIDITKKSILDQHDLKMIDPINVKQFIEDLQKEVQEGIDEIDFALSEVNAQTFIEI